MYIYIYIYIYIYTIYIYIYIQNNLKTIQKIIIIKKHNEKEQKYKF